jgi:hypothetical protein
VAPKRERGKPPSLPDECLVDLINLPHYYDSRLRSLSAICRHIVDRGGVRWIDNKTGKTVHEITNAGTLRTRGSLKPRIVIATSNARSRSGTIR